MSKTLLMYENAVPISSERHREWAVKSGENFSFAKEVNAVPLTVVEFPNAAAEYTIVFTGTGENVMPSVIMGVRDKENLYLKDDGHWNSKYVPAFVRRYPFVFASNDGGQNAVLCIDEEFEGFNQDGKGERLFDSDGNKTQYLDNVLEFLKQYQALFQRTRAFCQKLTELELLDPMHAKLTLKSGQQIGLGGFMVVNREKLKALDNEKLAELAKSDELELLYIHLQSMRNISVMAERLHELTGEEASIEDAGKAPEADAAPPVPPAPPEAK